MRQRRRRANRTGETGEEIIEERKLKKEEGRQRLMSATEISDKFDTVQPLEVNRSWRLV